MDEGARQANEQMYQRGVERSLDRIGTKLDKIIALLEALAEGMIIGLEHQHDITDYPLEAQNDRV